MDPSLPPANQYDPSRAGITGARKLVKHTILGNPKITAYLLAALVLAILVLAYLLYKSKKDHFAPRSAGVSAVPNYVTGSNSPKGFNSELSGPVSASDGGWTPSAGMLPGDIRSAYGLGSSNTTFGTAAEQQIGSLCQAASAEALLELNGLKSLGVIADGICA